MSPAGPYSTPDGPPAGWPAHHQRDWLYPPDDPFGEPYEDFDRGALPSMGIGWAGSHNDRAHDHARPVTREPERPDPPPLSEGRSGSPSFPSKP